MNAYEKKNPWVTTHRRIVYENPWIQVKHNEVINPAGRPGIYGVVHFKNKAIGIVPLDEDNNTWLVGQYRYTLEKYSWEIPEGGCPVDEIPLEAAKRELLEETGIQACEWTRLMDFHLSNSVSDEYGMVYLARELTFSKPVPDETEKLSVRKVPFAEAFYMVIKGEITDALSVMAILKVKILMGQGEM